MELTLQDQNELLKAALRCKDTGISEWLVGITEQFGEGGKRHIPCPPYRPNGNRLIITDESSSNGQNGNYITA